MRDATVTRDQLGGLRADGGAGVGGVWASTAEGVLGGGRAGEAH